MNCKICGSPDDYLCQICGKVKCGKCEPSSWRPDITGSRSAGNVCPGCLKEHKAQAAALEGSRKK